MIIRILTEGQWSIEETELPNLNELDDKVSTALEDDDQPALTAALGELLDAVRERGVEVPDDVIAESELILPAADATVSDVRAFLDEVGTGEGLIPDVD